MKQGVAEFLLVDAGNTRLKWATASHCSRIRLRGDIPTQDFALNSAKDLARTFPAQLVVLASVVPKLRPLFRKAFAGRLIEADASQKELGLRFDYPKPAEIGADRLAAAAAAAASADDRNPAIIVSCGTATAFTVLDQKGRLCGGAIAPGLQAQLDSLMGATAQLPATDLRQARAALAKSTKDAIRAGVMLNFQGGAKEIIRQLSASLKSPKPPRLVLTGGNARYLAKALGLPHTLRPLLVFEGLRIIGIRAWLAKQKQA
jgi:type III pantothenate kinase